MKTPSLTGDLIILPKRVFLTTLQFWGVFMSLNVSGFDFGIDAVFPVSVDVFSFWGVFRVGLTPLPALVVAGVSIFALYDWRPTDRIGAVSIGFFFSNPFYYAGAALLQHQHDMIFNLISATSLLSSILSASSHDVWTGGKGCRNFTLWLKYRLYFLLLSFTAF